MTADEERGRGAVVWLTGLPSSGKTTLARHVRDALRAADRPVALLDGDDVRAALRPTPGYDEAARDAFYDTLARLAALLAHQGVIVIVAATAHRAAFRARARTLAPRFLEVALAVPADVCAARDPKRLWADARAGRVDTLPGIGVPYEPPTAPDVTAAGGDDTDACARIVAILEGGERGGRGGQ